ncbi:ABC transporter ATP-binding protein [Desulforamulus aeronauticus]|uniref:ABC-2 type transport system ATP-binding protein n=1 Tax=Desulforamulus aeronauticus DSM 10349 TaxID=1121421 RepID=A0A1M6P197_9FIRM|nr:ABC transporter ATP-binding protein [Desulforamulus aeronauticus]SHK01711.1 ABC-2 type transport system ATP-binding protein [Desulforamulus aeronauticus DSM 10349]
MEYVVTTRELTRRFGNFTAVDRLNLSIAPGEIYGFLGPNGSGKSTTIRMLCGILEPSAGSGQVLGYDLASEAEKIKPHIGYMSQKFSLYDDLTVYENLDFYAGVYSIPYRERRHRIGEMIELASLSGREKDLVAHLSVGWKQRLALGCSIVAKPSILFLDEPTSGISPTSRKMFFTIIQRLANEGTTVMVTTHFMDEAERCSNIAFISEGRLIANDTPDQLRNQVLSGVLVEVEVAEPMQWLAKLENLPYVKECSLHGSLLHVLLEHENKMADLRVYTNSEVNPITPSLEDVFITLAKRDRG